MPDGRRMRFVWTPRGSPGEQHGVGDDDSYVVTSDGFEVRRNGKKVT
jgi:hypothetical protein